MSRRGIAAALMGAALAASVVGCAGKKNLLDVASMTVDEGYERGRRLLERRKTEDALEAFQAIDLRFAGEDRQELEPLIKLGIADATFYQGTSLAFIDARQLYLDFVTRYGDHPEAPYAQFQAGVCSLEQANHPTKDQSQTVAAFADLREVERRYPGSRYAIAARDMIRRAESRLAEHEFLVGRFYLKRKRYVAAAGRFKGLLERYPRYSEVDKVYLHLGEALLKDGKNVEGHAYLDKLLHDYPRSRYVSRAQKTLSSFDVTAAGATDDEDSDE